MPQSLGVKTKGGWGPNAVVQLKTTRVLRGDHEQEREGRHKKPQELKGGIQNPIQAKNNRLKHHILCKLACRKIRGGNRGHKKMNVKFSVE